jgi:hypothetical protein
MFCTFAEQNELLCIPTISYFLTVSFSHNCKSVTVMRWLQNGITAFKFSTSFISVYGEFCIFNHGLCLSDGFSSSMQKVSDAM